MYTIFVPDQNQREEIVPSYHLLYPHSDNTQGLPNNLSLSSTLDKLQMQTLLYVQKFIKIKKTIGI